MARFAVSKDMNCLAAWYAPSSAKQYLQRRLQSWQMCRQSAFTLSDLAGRASVSEANSSPCPFSSAKSAS